MDMALPQAKIGERSIFTSATKTETGRCLGGASA
jgi:hypothetical protein